MNEAEPNYCQCCGAAIIAESDQPHIDIGPRYRTLEPKWATMKGASTYSGLSVRWLQMAGDEGSIRITRVKRAEGMRRGRVLVDLRSLDAWIERWVAS